MKKYIILAAIMAACGTTVAYADNGSNELAEGKAFLDAKVTIAQAIANAEAKGGGKVSSVSFVSNDGNSQPFYHVELIGADGSQQDLAVDAATGEVSKVMSMEDGDHGDKGQDGENGQE